MANSTARVESAAALEGASSANIFPPIIASAEEKIVLEDEKTKLQTDNKHIEEIAREKYRMSKKGEKVFKVIEKEEQN